MSQEPQFCPYVGLQPFTETHHKYFKGRDRDQRIIVSNLYAAQLTVLYGPSGVGKSSLLQAGVIPQLRSSSRTAIIVFGEWQGGFLDKLKRRCIEAVNRAMQRPLEIDTTLSFDEILHKASTAFDGSILVVLDQFEEYLLYHPESDTDNAFEIELARAINREEVDANFLIALRDDALSKLDRFQLRIPNLLGNTLRLDHLNTVTAKEAILEPLEEYKRTEVTQAKGPVNIEDELVVEILKQVRPERLRLSESTGAGRTQAPDEKHEIATPFLQLVMTRLWELEAERDSQTIRLPTFRGLGGVSGIVMSHLDDTLNRLSSQDKQVAARIFHYLVTPSGTKIAQTPDSLEGYIEEDFSSTLKQPLEPILEKLSTGDKRILRSVPLPDEPNRRCYEIFHDVLAQAILDWRTRYANEQAIQKARMRLFVVGLAIVVLISLAATIWAGYSRIKTEQAQLKAEKLERQVEQERKSREELERAQAQAAKKMLADFLYSNGYKASLTNDPEEALEDFETALSLYRELEDKENQVKALIDIGKLYALRNNYAEAKRRYDLALEISRALHDFQALGRVFEKFAALSIKQGDRQRAIESYNQARKAYQEAKDPQSEGRMLEQLGVIEEVQGNTDKARETYDTALFMYRHADDQAGISRVLNSLNSITNWGFLLDLVTSEVRALKGNEIRIGRNVEMQEVLNDISFSSRLVSRRHLVIRRDLSVEDLRSRNGTSINGKVLRYGVSQRLVDKDIITLANIRPMQFLTRQPRNKFVVPKEAWGIFIDNQTKSYQYLTRAQYSLLLTNGTVSLKEGFFESALMKLQWNEKDGHPEMFEIPDNWHISFVVKETDYDYKEYFLQDDRWIEALDLPLTYVKLTPDRKSILEEGPSFQIVTFKEPVPTE